MKRWALGLLLLLTSWSLSLAAQPGPPSASEAFVTNPSSGASLFVKIYTSSQGRTEKYPVLVLIPGGRGAGSQSFPPPQAQRYADLGFLTIVFDPDGRGRSSGTENDNGYIGQDGLKAVIEYAVGLSGSDGRVVLASFSYGVTMATGVLARYPELPVVFYADWEGPADRNDTGGCDGSGLGHLKDTGCTNEAFWSEREATTFIKKIDVPYQRIQSAKDHVQPDNNHALLLVNDATSTTFGGKGRSPWTRLNDEAPNRIYTASDQPHWLPEGARTDEIVTPYLGQFLKGAIPTT